MAFKKVSKELGGFFNTKDHLDAIAVLFEPTGSRTTKGKFGDRLTIDADVTIFNTKEQLSGEDEPLFMENAAVSDSLVARDLEDAIGEMALVVCRTAENKKGTNPLLVIRDVSDPATIEAVEAHLKRRREKLESAKDDLPDWAK